MKVNLLSNKVFLVSQYRHVIMLGLLLVYSLILIFYLLMPKWELYSNLKNEQQKLIKTKNSYLAELKVDPQLNREITSPLQQQSLAALTHAISLAAAQARIQVVMLTPINRQRINKLNFQSVRLELKGNYREVMDFLRQLHVTHPQLILQHFILRKIAQQQELQLQLQIGYVYM